MGFDFGTVSMPYGDAWRTSRRLMHTHLNQGAAQAYQPIQMESARQFVCEILEAKQEIGVVSRVARANFGRMMAKILYGIEAEKDVREQLSISEKCIEAFKTGFTPGNFLVDVLPFCASSLSFLF
jgi:cytochrome P450